MKEKPKRAARQKPENNRKEGLMSPKSWRDLNQVPSPKKSGTPAARKRRSKKILRLFTVLFFLFLSLGGGMAAYLFAEEALQEVSTTLVPETPLLETTFESDGVLDEAWFEKNFRHRLPEDLLEVDIHELRMKLERVGQIKEAIVRRELPGTLEIRLRERRPLLRAASTDRHGQVHHYLVARDGFVYQGEGYGHRAIQNLPFLAGVSFKKTGTGIRPLQGMEILGNLLDLTREKLPALYATWKVVSCQDFEGNPDQLGARILVRGTMIGEIVFAPVSFDLQLERLAAVLQSAGRQKLQHIESVDLAYNSQAVVRLGKYSQHYR